MNKKWRHFATTISIIIALFVFGNDYFCIFKQITGIPCPTCGLTRAYYYLIQGNIRLAFYYHPLFFIFPLIIAMIIFYNYQIIKNILSHNYIIFFIGLAIFGTWIIRIIILSPSNPPMDFNKTAPLFLIISNIIHLLAT